MGFKESIENLRSLDAQTLLRDFRGLDPNDPGQWPLLPRVAALVGVFLLIVVGAFLFGYFLTITQFTQKAVDFLVHLPVGPYGVLALVMLGYLLLGAVMDELAMILLTVPVVFPAMVQLGLRIGNSTA